MSNRQTIGYMILAMKKAGYSKEEITKVFKEMYALFDLYTKDEAEEKGFKWYND